MSRHDFLRTSGAALLTGSLAGCEFLSTDPAQKDGGPSGGVAGRKGKEAPMLAELVKAGELPPVEERLPEKPMVVKPVEQMGNYGGTWHNALLGPSNSLYIGFLAGYDPLVRWTDEWIGAAGTREVEPNIAESFEVNADATEYTFRLRRGIRWSDGEPFTADDVVFAVEDVLLNTEISPVVTPLLSTVEGESARIEKLDDYSFRITFPAPSRLVLQRLATLEGDALTNRPFHYLKQFHKKYNPDVEQLAGEEGAGDWLELFQRKGGIIEGTPYNALWYNPELPTLHAWKIVTPVGEGSQVVMERNPYYWKVDPEGSQLPYMDRVVLDMVEDAEVMLLRTLNGEINLEVGPDTRFTSPANKPVLAESRREGNYRFLDASDTRMNVMLIVLNQAHKDEVKREVYQNRDFRIGLSHAINRREIIDVTLQSQGEPYQVAPLPNSPFYDEEFATQYLDYDVELANEFLDKSYPEKNPEGIRLGPDGEPISFTLEYVSSFRPEWTDMLELIRDYWREVGVEVRLKNEDRSIWTTRTTANEHDAGVWHGGGGLDVLLNGMFYFPNGGGAYYATPWGLWYSSRGVDGEEPPEAPKRQMELYDQLRSEPSPERQTRLMTEILDISKGQFYCIGTVRETQKYFIASNDFHNVPEPMIQCPTYPTPGPTHPEQYFIAG